MPQPQSLALTPALPSEVLTYILKYQSYPTTHIFCQSRADFLHALQRCVPNTVQRQPPLDVDRSSSVPPNEAGEDTEMERNIQAEQTAQAEAEAEAERQRSQAIHHPLLVATLQQIVTSRSRKLVFISTISHLRAYLAVFTGQGGYNEDVPPKHRSEKMGNRAPLLVVYGLVALHRDTSEWSAQGLGVSVAALVEAGKRSGRGVVVLEERDGDAGCGEGGGDRRVRTTGWEERLPMLNGSVKRDGLETEDGGWSGRTVEIGRVLGRWFNFEKGEWDQARE